MLLTRTRAIGEPDKLDETYRMTEWLSVLVRLRASATPCVLVTVAATRGSVPREAGTKMAVTEDAAFGTIGGGQLEYEALRSAREMLTCRAAAARLCRFGLGPSLGQCCGGTAEVLLEPTSETTDDWLRALAAYVDRGEPAVLVTALGDAAGGKLVVSRDGASGTFPDSQRQPDAVAAARALLDAADVGPHLEQTGDRAVLFEPIRPAGLHVVLFGAGHVGKALVRVLGELPCRVTWVDSRAEQFPRDLPPNVTVECTEAPRYVVARAPSRAAFLVMTHNHALDLTLCERILCRNDFSYFGLIGSATKRAKFTRRFKARGLSDDVIERMVCPIGIPELSGKHPGEIAIAVAAQLLMVRPPGPAGMRDQAYAAVAT
jgi:xanthine dehydrogenase accessory factor